MGGTLIIDNYYLPGTDKNNLRPNEYSGIITYQYEESAEAQHATQVARDATLEGIKYGALFWLLFLTGQLYPGAAGDAQQGLIKGGKPMANGIGIILWM